MVLVDDFREIWNCTSWLKKIVWIQPEIKREHGTTEALTFPFPFPFPFGRLKFEKRARDVEKEGVILSLTKQRRGVIRCALYITISFHFISFPFLSFPFRNHQSKQRRKVSSIFTPFLYRISAPVNNSCFLSLHTMLFFLVT